MDSAAREITPEGHERLREELALLCTQRREDVAEWLRVAREDGGDPSENGDLAQALEEQDRLERRIGQLEAILAAAHVVTPVDDGTIGIGTRAAVRCDDGRVVEYELVGASEGDASSGRISIASPVGRALSGRARGDSVVVETPRGVKCLEVVAVDNVATRLVPA